MQDFEFQFDLSDKELSNSNIVIREEIIIEKEIKKINKISELTFDQKVAINNILWYNKIISNSDLVTMFVEEFGLIERIAYNIVTIHRTAYLEDEGYYTLFEKNTVGGAMQEKIDLMLHYKNLKKSNKKKGIMNIADMKNNRNGVAIKTYL